MTLAVGLHHVRAARRDQFREGVLGRQILAGGDADVERVRQLRVTLHVLGRQRLFIPEAAHLLVDTPAPQGLITIEYLVGVHHHAPLLACHLEGQLDAAHVFLDQLAPHLDFR